MTINFSFYEGGNPLVVVCESVVVFQTLTDLVDTCSKVTSTCIFKKWHAGFNK